jgi:ABC-type Fe3+-hydroxamate transport system substrate-binding protein
MLRLLLVILCGFGPLLGADELRIVSYSPGATQTLIDLNCADKIIGASAWCPLPKNHPAVRTCDVFNPDIELLIKLKPTCVILPRLTNPLWANRCKQAGFNIILLSSENKNSVASDVRLIGATVKQNVLAEKIAQTLEEKSGKKSRRLLIIWDGMMAGEDSYLGNPMEAAGFQSPLTGMSWQKLDWEVIAKIKPDLFLWIENNQANSPIVVSEQHLSELLNVPAVKDLSSVKNRQVYATTSGSDWLPGTGLCRSIDKLKALPSPKSDKP